MSPRPRWPKTTTETPPGSWQPSPGLVEALAESQRLGAIGPGPLADHVRHAAGFLVAAEAASAFAGGGLLTDLRLLDIGSGGGLPGLVLAELLPGAHCTLLDGRTERIRLLDNHLATLGWGPRVETCLRRAEEAGRDPLLRGTFDLVVARGFAGPAVTAECGAPFLRPGGYLVVSEPPASEGSRWSATGLALLGMETLGGTRTVDLGDGQTGSYQVLRQATLCPERWPRRTGIPAKRPIF